MPPAASALLLLLLLTAAGAANVALRSSRADSCKLSVLLEDALLRLFSLHPQQQQHLVRRRPAAQSIDGCLPILECFCVLREVVAVHAQARSCQRPRVAPEETATVGIRPEIRAGMMLLIQQFWNKRTHERHGRGGGHATAGRRTKPHAERQLVAEM